MEGRFVSWTSHSAACRRMYLFISAVFLLCYKVATVVDTSVWFVSEAHRALLTLSPPARKGPRPVTWPGGPTVWKRAPRGPHLPMKHRRGEGHMEPRAGQQAGHHGDTVRSVGSSGAARGGRSLSPAARARREGHTAPQSPWQDARWEERPCGRKIV